MKANRTIKLIKFTSRSCGPCREFDTVLDKLDGEVRAKDQTFALQIEKVSIDYELGAARADRWNVSALPTTFLVCGRFRRRILGAIGIRELRARLERFALKRLSLEK